MIPGYVPISFPDQGARRIEPIVLPDASPLAWVAGVVVVVALVWLGFIVLGWVGDGLLMFLSWRRDRVERRAAEVPVPPRAVASVEEARLRRQVRQLDGQVVQLQRELREARLRGGDRWPLYNVDRDAGVAGDR